MNETMLPMRTKSTRNHIKDTFLVMLKKKPFLKIRITALCQKAGITRATFYAHYLDIYDLVDDIMNDALIFLDSITDRTCHESFEDLWDVVRQNDLHASDLVRFIKETGDFCVGCATYPEGHPESRTLDEDLENMKRKVDAGCDFLVTQMFFDNEMFYNFMYRLLAKGVRVPVVAGVMPITNAKQVERIFTLSGTPIPSKLRAVVERFGDHPEALRQAGMAYTTGQIMDLIANGFNHIHVYTMNKPEVIGGIRRTLSEVIKL